MPNISVDTVALETAVLLAARLANMVAALHIAMYGGSHDARNFRAASDLLTTLIGEHADSLQQLFDAGTPAKREAPNTSAREGSV